MFRTLYAAKDLHPGLVNLVPNVVQDKQVLLFRAALKRLAEIGRRHQQSVGGRYRGPRYHA